eukprot:jgi/Mesen1/7134/ME000369S06448
MAAQEGTKQDLEGKVAIVTGSSRGIGRGIALHLGARGAKIVVHYVGGKAEAEEVVAQLPEGRATAVQADIRKKEQVHNLFEQAEQAFGRIDILVNNAGFMDSTYSKVADISEENLEKTIDTNLKVSGRLGPAHFLLHALKNEWVKEAARKLQDGGRIVNVTTSLVAFTNPGYGVAAYAGTKAALETITKCMAPEMRGRRITVNAVAPGPIATELFYRGKSEEQVERIVKLNPLERIGQSEDIATVVGFLCSPEGEWVNAQIVRANGGYV